MPVVLDANSSAYARWRDLVLLTLQRYALADHVLADRTSTAPSWFRMDSVVLSWILGTLTVELQDVVREAGSTARQARVALESQFWGNRETRALHLDAAFRCFTQGDLSITEYCCQLKKVADYLRVLGEPIIDRTLILNLLRGLN